MGLRIHPRLTLMFSVALTLPLLTAWPQQKLAIKQFPLDERTIYEIPISPGVPTTIMLPDVPSSFEGVGFTSTTEAIAPVLISHTPGQKFFSVKPLMKDARANLNVIIDDKVYVFAFHISEQAYSSITIFDQPINGAVKNPQRITPSKLISLLDRAKSYTLVKQQYPEMVQQIEVASPGTTLYYKGFKVIVDKVFRFDREDTLVFRIILINETDELIAYAPQSVAVRVGTNVYYASISDLNGFVQPHTQTFGYFAITGNPRGGRANLSVKNEFNVLISRLAVPQSQ